MIRKTNFVQGLLPVVQEKNCDSMQQANKRQAMPIVIKRQLQLCLQYKVVTITMC